MKKNYSEFVFQSAAFIVAVILVHSLYLMVVRPRADFIMAEQAALMDADPDYVQVRSVWVIIRDFEQEACFILMLWAIAIMVYKSVALARERSLLQAQLVPLDEGARILPEDAREYARQLQSMPASRSSMLLPRSLLAALHRFSATQNIQDASATAHAVAESEADRLETELSMVRYIAWAIPSIGFIGTVRGIGEALGQAHRAVEGDIAGVTQSLGVAFNSTFIALLISIVLMFALHQVQLQQERLVLDTESYLDRDLIQHLQVH
jgi:biopolymer transport protein ExbB/TolQ